VKLEGLNFCTYHDTIFFSKTPYMTREELSLFRWLYWWLSM